jgi:hypothetical protein
MDCENKHGPYHTNNRNALVVCWITPINRSWTKKSVVALAKLFAPPASYHTSLLLGVQKQYIWALLKLSCTINLSIFSSPRYDAFIKKQNLETLHYTAQTLELPLTFEGPFHRLRVVHALSSRYDKDDFFLVHVHTYF